MSRIGKKSIAVPAGVNVTLGADRMVSVEKGSNKLVMTHRPEIDVKWDEGAREITCAPAAGHENERQARAFWGMTRALLNNMVEGMTKGYEKKIEVIGAGWNAKLKGMNLELNVGYCNPVNIPIPAELDVTIELSTAERTIVSIKGFDKQLVGQFAATARSKRKPEPYNGKGVKYYDETIIRKQGKAVVGR